YFFFSGRRRHTRFSRDWSSDVCSSDLDLAATQPAQLLLREIRHVAALVEDAPTGDAPVPPEIAHDPHGDGGLAAAGLADQPHGQIGRASSRQGEKTTRDSATQKAKRLQ